jgi:type IV pilus assembly protein PilA
MNENNCSETPRRKPRGPALLLRFISSLKTQSGFTLMELLIVMSIMIILMLIAIPNFISMRAQADETSAMQSLRAIYQAEIQYQINFPANGFACSLAALGGNPQSGPPSPQAAQVLQGDLATGQKSGYTFNIVNCNKVTVNNQDLYTSYEATAVPQSIGKSGHRGFCIDARGTITADPAGGTNCTQPVQ